MNPESVTPTFFKKVEFLSHLSDPVLHQVMTLFVERRYPAETFVIRENVPDAHFCIIKEGRVAVEKYEGGEVYQLGVLEAGECFGEMAIFDQTTPFATVRALDDLAVWEIAAPDLQAFIQEYGPAALEIYQAMFATLSQRLRNTSYLSISNEGLFELVHKRNEQLEAILSEVENARKELETKNRQLEDLQKKQNDFLGLVTHDLRNPLSIVENYASLLLEDLPDAGAYAEPIRRQAQQMLQLCNELLDLTKIEAGALQLSVETVSLVPLLKEVCEHWRLFAQKKQISVDLEVSESLPDVAADARKIHEVLNNLLSNAVKFTHAGGSIRLLAAVKDGGTDEADDDAEVVVTVCDSGLGIKPEELQRLFEKYPKVSTKATGGEKQHGLGLAIVRKIIGYHNGRVWAESDPGRGSSFSFSLSLAARAQRRAEA